MPCTSSLSPLAHPAVNLTAYLRPLLPPLACAGVKLVMEATCIMFDEKPKMVDDPNKMGKKVANYWCVHRECC